MVTFISAVQLGPTRSWQCCRWASKKAGGSTKNGRKSHGQRLGLKCGDGKSKVLLSDICITFADPLPYHFSSAFLTIAGLESCGACSVSVGLPFVFVCLFVYIKLKWRGPAMAF